MRWVARVRRGDSREHSLVGYLGRERLALVGDVVAHRSRRSGHRPGEWVSSNAAITGLHAHAADHLCGRSRLGISKSVQCTRLYPPRGSPLARCEPPADHNRDAGVVRVDAGGGRTSGFRVDISSLPDCGCMDGISLHFAIRASPLSDAVGRDRHGIDLRRTVLNGVEYPAVGGGCLLWGNRRFHSSGVARYLVALRLNPARRDDCLGPSHWAYSRHER